MRSEGGSEGRAIVKAVLTGRREKRHRERHRSQSPQSGLLQTGRQRHNQFNDPRDILTSAQ